MAESPAPAKVIEVLGRTGVRGEVIQVRCEVLDGKDTGKVLVRNVRGPVKAGDTLHLLETIMQARRAEGPKKDDKRKKDERESR